MLVFILTSLATIFIYLYIVSNINNSRLPSHVNSLRRGVPIVLFLIALFVFVPVVVFFLIADYFPRGTFFRNLFDIINETVIISLILGVIFGFISSNWVHFALNPKLIENETIARSHKTWGYVVIVLLVFGLLSDSINSVSSMFQRGVKSISTPFASIDLYQQSQNIGGENNVKDVVKNISNNLSASGTSGSDVGVALSFISRLADNNIGDDVIYSKLTGADKMDINLHLEGEEHKKSRDFTRNIIEPIAYCISAIFKAGRKTNNYNQNISEINRIIDRSIINTKIDKDDSVLLETEYNILKITVDRIKYVAKNYIDLNYIERKCVHQNIYRKSIERFRKGGSIPNRLPYAAIAHGQLLYMQGYHEAAIARIMYWIAKEHDDTLPDWYILRARNTVSLLLQKWRPNRGFVEWSRENLKRMERLFFSVEGLRSKRDYNEFCKKITHDRNRLYFSYYVEANTFSYYAAIYGEYSAEARELANLVKDLNKDCFPVGDYKDWYRAQFLDTYGFNLFIEALQKIGRNRDRSSYEETLKEARTAVHTALDILQPYVLSEEASWRKLPLQERIFAERSERETAAKFEWHLDLIEKSLYAR